MKKVTLAVLAALLCACAGVNVQEPNPWDYKDGVSGKLKLADVYVTKDATSAGLQKVYKKIGGNKKKQPFVFYQLEPGSPEANFTGNGFSYVLSGISSKDDVFKQYWHIEEPLREYDDKGCFCYQKLVNLLEGPFYDSVEPTVPLFSGCKALPVIPSSECYDFLKAYRSERYDLERKDPVIVLTRFQVTKSGYVGAVQTMLHGYSFDYDAFPQWQPWVAMWLERIASSQSPVWFVNVVYSPQKDAPAAIVASRSLLAAEEASRAVLEQAGEWPQVSLEESLFSFRELGSDVYLFNSLLEREIPKYTDKKIIQRLQHQLTGHARVIDID